MIVVRQAADVEEAPGTWRRARIMLHLAKFVEDSFLFYLDLLNLTVVVILLLSEHLLLTLFLLVHERSVKDTSKAVLVLFFQIISVRRHWLALTAFLLVSLRYRLFLLLQAADPFELLVPKVELEVLDLLFLFGVLPRKLVDLLLQAVLAELQVLILLEQRLVLQILLRHNLIDFLSDWGLVLLRIRLLQLHFQLAVAPVVLEERITVHRGRTTRPLLEGFLRCFGGGFLDGEDFVLLGFQRVVILLQLLLGLELL